MEERKENAIWEFVKVVVISVAIVLPIRTYIAQPFIVSGASMEPNFHDGEYLIIDELTYAFQQPKRGEVIVFRYPLKPSEFFIKRIIGLPNETVEISNGKILINNSELAESYFSEVVGTSQNINIKMILAKNEYFVLGDNRPHSSDSRFWGALPKEKIMGRVLLRLWPVAKAGIL
ncbi:signal peptidase I [Candidatus Giovannonibacteria bacterium RIFCSPLOWO2_01_FULL_44_40]|uniref:Signal peptidase I n=1 Tax=Candidatus Giovannonibacteria bacterium RIFCSPHIGHO2_01_FULL_45_23 TaxID=1798325 RepID=A0A1F5VFU9_9BACT|nr:MAG: signal peptidase I [Candidatus Giovannonibacteria bacterium RIFCSPHIGHO2_01_FULL_45_23]OGF75147.1 MAG: signal peptidase I [Candidatus Giovannonibacteria bacterium RIFCSPHIGHO2_02_FULL_45_13]OGF79711.1 MAG: signal peptidase I [Candidatus Giovannonibacteria bacterium RIFCSPLOWO2_01_FULL_44_40]